MKIAKVLTIAAIWIASLVVVAWAQGRGTQPPTVDAPSLTRGQPDGEVITGANLGFQPLVAFPDRNDPAQLKGVFVVRGRDGKWYPVDANPMYLQKR